MDPRTNNLATFTNSEYGIASFVVNGYKGYHIRLLDTDADQFVPCSIVEQDLEVAKDKARELVK